MAPSIPAARAHLRKVASEGMCDAREAREQGKALRAHHAHMLVHGLLHLAGLDHERASQANRMESRERAVLARLGFEDPYA